MIAHWYRCDLCGHRRIWGRTDTRTWEDEIQKPLLICVTCAPEKHVPHHFDEYQVEVFG